LNIFITRSVPMAKTIPYHGVVAVGSNKQEAIAQYRGLAKGKDATLFANKTKSLSFVSNAAVLSHVFNPLTGDMDMSKVTEMPKALATSFASESSTEKREVNHYECKAGCGGHVVYDSDSLLKYCPICTTAIADDNALDGEEDDTDLSDNLDEGEEMSSEDEDIDED